MAGLNEQVISCPYCGENIDVLIDAEEIGEQYIEDCQVCCRPIVFAIDSDEQGEVLVNVYAENESY